MSCGGGQPFVGLSPEEAIDGIAANLGDAETLLGRPASLTGIGELRSDPPVTSTIDSVTSTQSSAALFVDGVQIASGTVALRVDYSNGAVGFTISLTESALKRTLKQQVFLTTDGVMHFGSLAFSDGSPALVGGWNYSATGRTLTTLPQSDSSFELAVEEMFHSTNNTALSAGSFFTQVANIVSDAVNYARDLFVPYVPPMNCTGPDVLDGAGQSCHGVAVCEQKIPEICGKINDLPGVSTGFKKCMGGRCGCGGSHFPRIRVNCGTDSQCGPCGPAWGCSLNGADVWYCNPNSATCTCVDTIMHEMSHGCLANDRNDGSDYDAYRIGDWFYNRCIPSNAAFTESLLDLQARE